MTDQHAAAVRLAHLLDLPNVGTVQAQRLIARGRRQSTGSFAHQTRGATR